MKEKIKLMLEMQDSFNKVVNPNWLDANYQWSDAIMVESTELLDHFGWKWWKKQTPDINQCKMELIDIWHFIMSDMMQKMYNNNFPANDVIEATEKNISHCLTFHKSNTTCTTDDMVRFDIRGMINLSSDNRSVIEPFLYLLDYFDISSDELFKMYVGKNVLNNFRQAHGYKTGQYIKDWNGKEDNEVLTEILNTIDDDSPNFSRKIYEALETAYNSL